MSEVGEIAAPLGEEAWDDTALLDVSIKMSDYSFRPLNEQLQHTTKRKSL